MDVSHVWRVHRQARNNFFFTPKHWESELCIRWKAQSGIWVWKSIPFKTFRTFTWFLRKPLIPVSVGFNRLAASPTTLTDTPRHFKQPHIYPFSISAYRALRVAGGAGAFPSDFIAKAGNSLEADADGYLRGITDCYLCRLSLYLYISLALVFLWNCYTSERQTLPSKWGICWMKTMNHVFCTSHEFHFSFITTRV